MPRSSLGSGQMAGKDPHVGGTGRQLTAQHSTRKAHKAHVAVS